jgi:hypothetical protein
VVLRAFGEMAELTAGEASAGAMAETARGRGGFSIRWRSAIVVIAVVGLVTAGCSGNGSGQRSQTPTTGTVADPPGLVRSREFGPEVARHWLWAPFFLFAA